MNELLNSLKKLGGLYIQNARLTAVEKLTLLLSAAALFAVVALVGFVALLFFGFFLCNLLDDFIPAPWGYLVVAGFFALLVVLAYLFRRRLLVDPIARFVSRMFLKTPEK